MDFLTRTSKDRKIAPEPPAKRISTPAGQRLSVILDNGDAKAKTRVAHRASVRKSGLSAALADAPRESLEDQSNDSSGYSYSVWSDGEKFGVLRNPKQIAKQGGWRKLAIIILGITVLIIALAVGLAVGLKKKGSNNNSNQASPNAAEASATSNPDPSSDPTATTGLSPTSTPSNFPLGSYSMITFLDTVQTTCTSNSATWTCYPYTEYNTDPNKAIATFNWIISSPSSGNYQISSTENPFSISFQNADLELLDEGQDTERYRFQLEQTKTVSVSQGIIDDGSAVECDFDNTSLQAYLYTKMARSYPDTSKGEPDGDPSFPVWPFAVRVEQVGGSGSNTPTCYKFSNGSRGDKIEETLSVQDGAALCSCLYKNWRTPTS